MERLRFMQGSPMEVVALDEPCRVFIRSSWALMVLGLLVASDASPGPEPTPVRVDDVPGWVTLRALLLHGVVLRDAVAHWPAAAVDRVQTAEDLVALIARQGPAWWTALLQRAADMGWAYHLARGSAGIAQGDDGPEDDSPVVQQARLWGVPALAARQLAQDQTSALSVLAAVLRPVAAFIDASRPRLPRSTRQTFADVGQAFLHLTGRPMKATEPPATVHELTVIPTPGLGAVVPVVRAGTRWIIWTAEQSAAAARGPTLHRTLAILGDELNQRILEALAAGGAAYAQSLAEPLHAHPSTLSRHLNELADAGVVLVRPEGHRVWYLLNRDALQPVAAWLAGLAQGACTADDEPARIS